MREYENNSPHAYLTTLSLKQAIMDIIFEFQKEYPFLINFRVLFVIIPISIRTERPIKMLLVRMASTYNVLENTLLGSASIWLLDHKSVLSSSTRQPNLCIHWSLTGNTAPPSWIVTLGRRRLVRKPPYSEFATRKGPILWVISGLF